LKEKVPIGIPSAFFGMKERRRQKTHQSRGGFPGKSKNVTSDAFFAKPKRFPWLSDLLY